MRVSEWLGFIEINAFWGLYTSFFLLITVAWCQEITRQKKKKNHSEFDLIKRTKKDRREKKHILSPSKKKKKNDFVLYNHYTLSQFNFVFIFLLLNAIYYCKSLPTTLQPSTMFPLTSMYFMFFLQPVTSVVLH